MVGQKRKSRHSKSNESKEKLKNDDKKSKKQETDLKDDDADKPSTKRVLTSKLRLQLGMAPLETDDTTQSNFGIDTKDKKEFEHVPAKNIGEEEKAEKLREKLRLLKEKRELEQKLGKIKKIYDVDDPNTIDDVTSWVAKSRKLKPSRHETPKVPKIPENKHALTVEHDFREFDVSSCSRRLVKRLFLL
ncbi:U4/U6.U5 tri-snRNP-associated protein 1 [Thelohanellus kitauei]|uniref:U4/U6.U5 tri-snRNP-associated protein 1 n=1 Tax=Thelohanellus kitauei TaxID=669202 RepID=A0A0C2MTF7_THEKT|nr:U4/U6.U5 tri-snRNP-associated protein 1 [Thelohanellus kitauei]